MAQLHVYADGLDTVPEEIVNSMLASYYSTFFISETGTFTITGISGQITPVRPVPKRLDEFTKEELENFPKLFDFPEQYVIK